MLAGCVVLVYGQGRGARLESEMVLLVTRPEYPSVFQALLTRRDTDLADPMYGEGGFICFLDP